MSDAQTGTTAREASYLLPFAKKRDFVGRKNELETLRQRLLTNHESTMAIIGPGGAGKTQIALQFAHIVKDTMPAVSIFWIPAWSIEIFEQTCEDIVAALQINQADTNITDAKLVLREHLSTDEAGEWLVVLDDADAIQGELHDYIPQSKKGMTLITSRLSAVKRLVETFIPRQTVLPLGPMSLMEAVEFLQKSLIREELAQENLAMRLLVQKLECWPLAIAQAAAYLNMNKISVSDYMQLLYDTELDLKRIRAQEVLSATRNKSATTAILTTFILSFAQLRERNLVAADLLASISCIGWGAIPRSLLLSMEFEQTVDEIDAINTLCSYSLLTRRSCETPAETSGEEWYDMHPVVHSATCMWMSRIENAANTALRTVKHFTYAFASVFHPKQTWRAYKPHAAFLENTISTCNIWTNSGVKLFLGQCLLLDDKSMEALSWLKEDYEQKRRTKEVKDADRLLTEYTLAMAYGASKQFKEAVALLEHVVAVQEDVLVDHHPRRLVVQYALARTYTLDGQSKKAEALLDHVIAVQDKVLAEFHTRQLPSQHALAHACESNRQSVSMATSSVTDMVPYTLAGTTLIETDSEAALMHMHNPKSSKSNERDDDCNSVVSNNEDIGSQIGTGMRTHAELHAVNVLGNFFGELTELRVLHDKLFERFGRERFRNNYRRILKYHVLRLEEQSEARTQIEAVTIRILKSRQNRNSIAQKIIELLDPGDEDVQNPFDPLDCQTTTKEELAKWMQGLAAVDAHDFEGGPSLMEATIGDEDSSNGIDDHSDHGEESDEDCDDDGKTGNPFDPQDDFDTNFTSVIDSSKEFLRRHIGILSLELGLLLLPAWLREVVESVPREDIHILHTNDITFVNRIKAFVEDNTSIEWDWWPLKSRVPDLPPDRQLLEWQVSGCFFYRGVTSTEAAGVQSVLDQTGNHPPRCYCCAAKASQQNTSQFLRELSRSFTTPISEKIQNYWPISSSISTAQQRYTPSNTPAAGTSPASANDTPGPSCSQPSNTTGNVTPTRSSTTEGLPTNRLQGSAWVVFGIEDGSGFDDIENIDTSCPFMHDATFFTELKRLEKKRRWSFLAWLSPYLFCYCKFVRFETMNVDLVYPCGEFLPEDHKRESQYLPRDPTNERPPIGKEEFTRYLRTCGSYCLWSRLPLIKHRCCRPRNDSHKWKRIPRKKRLFDTKENLPENDAYGLEAAYVLSFPMVFIYHTISILAWFGFWVWWLKLHPGDLQNASIPMMVFLGILASFWVLPGRQKSI